MRTLVVAAVVSSSTVAAAQDVNLLPVAPIRIAVSSTVDNAKIKPAHLVDGKLDTAWNSETGDLVGAWIRIEVPPTVHVAQLRMTVGFTAVDPKLGDLFAQNPRIKKVRVRYNDDDLGEVTLDPKLRTLQAIPVNRTGGIIKLEVTAIEPGRKKTWREVSVSELEVWGTAKTTTASTTAVTVGSFSTLPVLSRSACLRALYPQARATVVETEQLPFSKMITLCRAVRIDGGLTYVDIVPVDRMTKKRLGQVITDSYIEGPATDIGDMVERYGDATMALEPWTLTETILRVDTDSGINGPMRADRDALTTYYRVTTEGLVPLFDVATTSRAGEGSDADRCEVVPWTPAKTPPKKITLDCVREHGHWHDANPGLDEDPYKVRLVWNGDGYDRK